MKITAVEKVKGTRYKIFVDEEYWYILDLEVMVDAGIRPGLVCDADFLEEVRHRADVRRAKERALHLLSVRDYSRRELADKLAQNVSEEIAEQVAGRMEELGLIRDEEYARKLARDLIEVKKRGIRRARYEMMQRGLSTDLIDASLEGYGEEETYTLLCELVERKYLRYLGDEKGRRRVMNALSRLGHSYHDIQSVLDEYTPETQE
ncbi:MAG TPA: RecX family transcriptional regulator [Firmicutes bacterium]|nr:RecX family transcriptional regulator [Bacillota bacterium]